MERCLSLSSEGFRLANILPPYFAETWAYRQIFFVKKKTHHNTAQSILRPSQEEAADWDSSKCSKTLDRSVECRSRFVPVFRVEFLLQVISPIRPRTTRQVRGKGS